MAIDVIEFNAETGEQIEREFTPDELAQRELDKATADKMKADEEARESAKAALLDRLGITSEEAQLLLG